MYDIMFIHHVGKAWYRLYWVVITLANVSYIAAYIVLRSKPTLHHYAPTFAIGTTLVVLAGVGLLYNATAYWVISKHSDTLATFCASMPFLLLIFGGLTGTGFTTAGMAYVTLWCVAGLFSGMFGLLIAAGAAFMPILYVLSVSNFQIGQVGIVGATLVIGNALCALGGYLFWRTHYDDQQSKTLSQLSTMLRSNQQQSEILLQSIADGVIVINTEGKITLMNAAAATMTEWPVSDANSVDVRLVAKLQREGGEDIPSQENPFGLALTQMQHVSQIVQLVGRNSKKQIISLVISPILLPKTNEIIGAVAVMRDISEQRAVDQQRAEFISTAAHEMRTPVAAIEGYLSLSLNEKVSSIDARARGYLEKAHASTQHLGQLFQDLLTSSKAEDGRLSNHPVVVEMSGYLQQLTDDLKFTAEKKGLFVEFVIGTAQDTVDATTKDVSTMHMIKPFYYVLVDPDRMREVITNLFDNACKYTEQGKIAIGLTGNNEVAQIYVRDTGSGIPAEDIPHLFQKFYRVDNSVTRTIGGTGLGLFICRKIVELYHGRIWVESTLGKGTTFFINLPRLSAQRANELQAQNEPTIHRNVAPSNTIKSMVQ